MNVEVLNGLPSGVEQNLTLDKSSYFVSFYDLFLSFAANSSASLRSSLLGLPLFIPPNNFRKANVLNPLHVNSSTVV